MAATSKQDSVPPAVVETVNAITKVFRSLPRRPTIEDLEAAIAILSTVQNDEDSKLDEISKQKVPKNVPEELFSISQQMRKTMVLFESHEQRREAIRLIELDKMLRTFDDLIQRASELVSGDFEGQKPKILGDSVAEIGGNGVISDQNLKRERGDEEPKRNGSEGLVRSSSPIPPLSSGEEESGKLSLMKVAALIETIYKSGSIVLNLKGKLMEKMELLPVSIGKLSNLVELELSENKIMALPPTINGLGSLTKFAIHSNQLINLPSSFGELVNLTYVDLHANRLKSLPTSFGNLKKLIFLDVSLNQFTHLPEIVGNLTSLKTLNAENNSIEDLPYTIGSCSSVVELRLDFNELKALPEAIGKLERLEILTLHYNRIRGLPTTMGNLPKLRELDVSFNELESISENLCFAVSLRKLNFGKNFADLTALPRSIGNLEMLEELDISANQIRYLPDSFRFLSKLRVLRTDETPLEDPPRQVLELGAQAIVRYMADSVAKRDNKTLPTNDKGFWLWFCSICCSKRGDAPKYM